MLPILWLFTPSPFSVYHLRQRLDKRKKITSYLVNSEKTKMRKERERKGQYKAHVLSSRLWAWLVSQCHPYKWGPESTLVVYVQIPPCPKALAGSGVLNTKPSKTIVSKTLRSKHIGSQWLGIYAPFLIDKMSLGTSSNDNNNKKNTKTSNVQSIFGLLTELLSGLSI